MANLKEVGFVPVIILPNKALDFVSYGMDDEPHPEVLLRRERAQLFRSSSECEAAIDKTIAAETKRGSVWVNNCKLEFYSVWEIEPETKKSKKTEGKHEE